MTDPGWGSDRRRSWGQAPRGPGNRRVGRGYNTWSKPPEGVKLVPMVSVLVVDDHPVVRSGPSVAQLLLDAAVGAQPSPANAFPQLTPRELQILDCIARGEANAVIARSFAVANKTVSNHISAIFAKLRVATRAEAIVLAREHGLGRSAAGGP